MEFIPYGRQNISQADIDAVTDVLKSDFLTQGPAVPAFEKVLCDYTGASHAVAVNSATSALHIACCALGVGEGDIVWTSPITFVATSNAALYCGASIDFVDIDSETFNMDMNLLEQKLRAAKQENALPKVVIPVHMCGQSASMRELRELSHQYGFAVIEDASHAVGGRYMSQPIGYCEYSDIAIFSFHPVKIVTTAEGGMAMTNRADLAEKMRLFRSHGVTRDKDTLGKKSEDAWYYEQKELGFNYRLTDIQAALGVSQMARVNDFVSKRNRLADRYDEILSALPIDLPERSDAVYSAWHLYVIRLRDGGSKRSEVFAQMRENGAGVNVHYIPVHRQPYYQDLGFELGDFPIAEDYYNKAMSIPLYPQMSEDQQDRVVGLLAQALG